MKKVLSKLASKRIHFKIVPLFYLTILKVDDLDVIYMNHVRTLLYFFTSVGADQFVQKVSATTRIM